MQDYRSYARIAGHMVYEHIPTSGLYTYGGPGAAYWVSVGYFRGAPAAVVERHVRDLQTMTVAEVALWAHYHPLPHGTPLVNPALAASPALAPRRGRVLYLGCGAGLLAAALVAWRLYRAWRHA